MESTGKYWVPVWNDLEAASINVITANPKWGSVVKGNKDAKKDSNWIGDLFRMGLVPGSYNPIKDIRILREFTPPIGESSCPCVLAKRITFRMLLLCAT